MSQRIVFGSSIVSKARWAWRSRWAGPWSRRRCRVIASVILSPSALATLKVPFRADSAGMVTVTLSPANSKLVPLTQPVARATSSAETLSMRSPTHLPASLSAGLLPQPAAIGPRRRAGNQIESALLDWDFEHRSSVRPGESAGGSENAAGARGPAKDLGQGF